MRAPWRRSGQQPRQSQTMSLEHASSSSGRALEPTCFNPAQAALCLPLHAPTDVCWHPCLSISKCLI